MSIVTDFKAINSRLRGDDWWEPEVVAVATPITTCEHRFSEINFRCAKCGVGMGTSMSVASAVAQWTPEELAALFSLSPMPVVLNKRLIERLRKPD